MNGSDVVEVKEAAREKERREHPFVCSSCGETDPEEEHSGGECNFCHAMNKDD